VPYKFKTRSVVPGEYALTAASLALVAGYPAVADVEDGVFYGTSGTEYEGELVIAGVDPADVVSADYVLIGHDNYVGGDAGNLTLPNTDGSTANPALVLDNAHYGTGNATAGTLDLDLYRLITSGATGGETPSTIAEAIVAELESSGTLIPAPATIQRGYRPTFDLKDMTDLHVIVVPRGEESQPGTRALVMQDISVDVGVMQKVDNGASLEAELDTLMDLVRDIKAYFQGRVLTDAPSARWIQTENEPIYQPDHVDGLRQFTSVITLTYRLYR